MPKVKALHPAYYTKFACIGSACIEHCCKQWRIDIDKQTYMKYRKIRDPEFVAKLKTAMKRTKEGTEEKYAEILLKEDKLCPFMEDGLCTIQKNYGHNYLSVTCQKYPRSNKMVQPGLIELSLYSSCEELVRIGLFPEAQMAFEVSELELEPTSFIVKSKYAPTTTLTNVYGPLCAYGWQIREGVIDILQNRSLPLPDRIFLVGRMLDKLTGLAKGSEDDHKKTPSIVNAFVHIGTDGGFESPLETVRSNPDRQAGMLSVLLHSLITRDINAGDRPTYAEFKEIVYSSLLEQHKTEANSGELYELMLPWIERFWEPFMEEKGHVLENYFVNLVFTLNYPFHYQLLNMYQHFIVLAEQYATIKLVLCANAAKNNGVLTDEKLTSALTTLSRDVMHNKVAQHIVEMYGQTQNDTLAHISFILY